MQGRSYVGASGAAAPGSRVQGKMNILNKNIFSVLNKF
jgi:hypothetical protein